MSVIKDKLAKAKLPQRSVEICLNGDLTAEHEQAEQELEQAQRKPADSLAGNGVGELVARIEALEAEMQESTEVFILRALPHRRTAADDRPSWRELMRAHPPRRDDAGDVIDDDKGNMLNVDTFYEDLIRQSTVSPEMDDDDWDALFSVISDGQFTKLSLGAWLLNRGDIDVPFSRAVLKAKTAIGDA